MANIGQAYVQIIPKADGISGNISKMLDGEATSAGKSAGAKIATGIGAGLKVAGAAAIASTAAVGGFIKESVKAGSEYESAFAQVETIMDTTVMSAGDMSNAIQSLSSEMAVSASELSSTVYNAISATGDTAHATELAAQASKLATAGFTDTGSALSVLTTAMNAYSLSADEASNISDSLLAVQNLGVTTVGELSSSMGKAIASASAYNINLANLESGYVSLTKGGINTAESTTYLSSMFKELGSTGSKVGKTIQQETGKSFAQLMSDGASLGDVLKVLSDSVNGDATALMNLWSSAEAGKAANAIVSQGLDEFNNNLKTIQNSAGMTQSAYETMANTLEHKTAQFKTLGTNLMTSVYQGISGDLGSFVDIGNQAIMAISEGFQSGGVSGMMDAVGTALSDIISYITGKLPEFTSLGMNVLSALGQGLIQNLPLILVSAQEIISQIGQALISAAPTLLQAGLGIIGFLAQSISSALPTLIPTLVNLVLNIADILISNAPMLLEAGISLITGLADGILQALPVLIERLPELIQSMVTALVNGLPMLIEGAITLINGIVAALPEIIIALVDALPQIIESVVSGLLTCLPQLIEGIVQLNIALAAALPQTAQALYEAIPMIIESIVNMIIENGPQFLMAVMTIGQQINTSIMTIGSSLLTMITTHLTNILTTVTTYLSQLPSKAAQFAGQMVGQFISFMIQLPGKITEVFNNVMTSVKNFAQKFIAEGPKMGNDFKNKLIEIMKTIPGKMLEIGGEIVEGLKNGISGAWGGLKEWLNGMVGDFIGGLKEGFKIGSPSRVMADEIGKWIPAGIAMGIEENQGIIEQAMSGMSMNMMPYDSTAVAMGALNRTVADGKNVNVIVSLEGDADRLFRVMQAKATSNYRLTGNSTLVTV